MGEHKANAAALDEAIKCIRRQKKIIAVQRTGVLCAAAAVILTIVINFETVSRR